MNILAAGIFFNTGTSGYARSSPWFGFALIHRDRWRSHANDNDPHTRRDLSDHSIVYSIRVTCRSASRYMYIYIYI